MAPVVLWSMARGPADPDFVAGAAAAVGRLVHADRPPVSDACLYALALLEVAAAGAVPADLSARVRAHRRRAEHWGGAPASARIGAITSAAVLHSRDPESARAAAGDDGPLAAALVGLGSGA